MRVCRGRGRIGYRVSAYLPASKPPIQQHVLFDVTAGGSARRSPGDPARRATDRGSRMLKSVEIGGEPAGLRAAIVSTFPPRACGIGTFAADVRAGLIGLDEIASVAKVVVVDDPSRPQRPGLVATISQATRGDYVRAA